MLMSEIMAYTIGQVGSFELSFAGLVAGIIGRFGGPMDVVPLPVPW